MILSRKSVYYNS